MGVLSNLFQGTANETAVNATNAAVDSLAARPFHVVLSIDDSTRLWLTATFIGVVIAFALLRKKT